MSDHDQRKYRPDDQRKYRPDDFANPVHYRDPEKGECIDSMPHHFLDFLRSREGEVTDKFTYAQIMVLGFCMGNSFKYKWRAGIKDSETLERDTAKAAWYDAFAKHLLDPTRNPDPRDGSLAGNAGKAKK